MEESDIESEDKVPKKNFLVLGFIGCSLLAWLAQTAIGGFIYATAAFFTKEGWEKWKGGGRD